VDPMSGQGIFAAFVSGRLAAQAVADYIAPKSASLANYEAAVDRELMPDIRPATLLRDAYHCVPGLCYAVMRRSAFLRASLCRLMLGELTYAGFLGRAGPLRPAIRLVATLGRRSRAGARKNR